MLNKTMYQWLLLGLLVLAQAGMFTHELSHYAKQSATASNARLNAANTPPFNTLAFTDNQALDQQEGIPSTKSPAHRGATNDVPLNGNDSRLFEICVQCLGFTQLGVLWIAVLFVLLQACQSSLSHHPDGAQRVVDIISAAYCARAPPLFISTRA